VGAVVDIAHDDINPFNFFHFSYAPPKQYHFLTRFKVIINLSSEKTNHLTNF
jgi:hypothetical protein